MGTTIQWPAGTVSPRLSSDAQTVEGTQPTQLFRLSEVFEEAYSRCGLELREAYHIVDGLRSLRLLFQEWSNRGVNLWTIVHEEVPLIAGQQTVTTPPDTADVMNVFIRMDSGVIDQMDYYLPRMSTDEYDRLPQKLQQERPLKYWMDRAPRFPTIVLWPLADQAYSLFFTRLRTMRSPATGLTGELDAPDRMIPALIAGLAWMLASKNKEAFPLLPGLRAEADRQWLLAGMEDREKSDFRMTPMVVWP